MLRRLQIENVGPSERLDLTFSERVNIFTGDNGLGKSFILDVAWWALTRQWPQDLNPAVRSGRMAYPPFGERGEIAVGLSGETGKEVGYTSTFDPKLSAWKLPKGRPTRQGLVIYAMLDGGFSIWDPARNYRKPKEQNPFEHSPAFVYTATEVWKGKEESDGYKTCNGIVADMLYWLMEKAEPYRQLKAAFETLSPPNEPMTLGGITRMMDAQRYACVRMPYKKHSDVPIVLLSSAIKRVLSIAYFLVWAWQEHKVACEKIGEQATSDMTIIIDEIEAHLHPRWQKNILMMLQKAVESLTHCVNIQYIVSTHSPLVMASCEDFFCEHDTWIDIDLKDGSVIAERKDFTKKGDVSKWLLSDAFDLESTRSNRSQEVLSEAQRLMDCPSFDEKAVRQIQERLEEALPSRDSFWLRWNVYLARNNCTVEL